MNLNIEARALLNDISHNRVWRSNGLDWRSQLGWRNCGNLPERVKVGKKLGPLIAAGYVALREDGRYETTAAGESALAAATVAKLTPVTLRAA